MRINFVTSAIDGCYVYRCQNPITYSKHDCRGDVDLRRNVWFVRPDILEAQIVIFHRPLDRKRLEMIKLFKAKGVRVGLDNDDTWELSPGHRWYNKINTEYFNRALEAVDFITCSTKPLQREYKKKNKNVFILPNLIDFKQYKRKPLKFNNKKKRVLLSGAVVWCDDAFNFMEVLKWLDNRDDIQLVLFGNVDTKLKLPNAEIHNYVPPYKYPAKLRSLKIDVCLIPREDNYFNRVKSNCKYLEMAASHIPVIAQSFKTKDSPYDLIAKEGAPINLAETMDDWKVMIDNYKPYKKEAFEWVFGHYNAKLNYFDEVIERII